MKRENCMSQDKQDILKLSEKDLKDYFVLHFQGYERNVKRGFLHRTSGISAKACI